MPPTSNFSTLNSSARNSEKRPAAMEPRQPLSGAVTSVAATPTQRIPVTQPFLPPLEEFLPYLESIWQSKWLTNDGPFHQQLERELCKYLGVPYISLFANGTLALIAALRVLGATGEVITTPYSFVATAHALLWTGTQPVFADIDPESLNLDPEKIEAAITSRTTAILPVHCHGRPCNVDRIGQIAAVHGLKVIYDAAHAFGVRHRGGSLLNYGDLSVLSFHATKVFSTFEGGAIVSHDAATKRHIDRLKNFGILDEVTVATVGINAKMSEIAAAFGLLQLKHMETALSQRRSICSRYRERLAHVPGIHFPPEANPADSNGAYFPILVGRPYPLCRDALYQRLKDNGIYARRYFYPLIADLPMYREMVSANRANLPVAGRTAAQVLCLPVYPDLQEQDQAAIVALIEEAACHKEASSRPAKRAVP